MTEAVSSHEFLRQQGATFVVFHPCGEQLVLGLGCSEQPAVVPACVAYRRKSQDHADQGAAGRSQRRSECWPHQQAYEALLQVQRLLHLPAPPKPPTRQQQSQEDDQQQSQPNSREDGFKAAKAGLVSQKQVPEGSDGFVWLDDKQQEKILQQLRQRRQQQQQQQQRQQGLQQQQQPSIPEQSKLPCFAGGQVPALWPPENYDAHWLMTPDNHIAGLDSLPQHVLLDRFEATWGWALQQLGLPKARCRHLSAVLAVPIDMTAAEVRLLADLLLGRLGFAALVVHLEPIAACFGNGTTSACIINVGSSSCSVCCVDDAVVLPPLNSRFSLPYGLVDVSMALTGWMGCYGHWPAQLQQQGAGSNSNSRSSSGGAGSAQDTAGEQGPADAVSTGAGAGACYADIRDGQAVSPGSIYRTLLLEDLVLQQCYLPKENYQPGLLGQPMLEDQQPAVVPVRIPGQPTTNYSVSLGSWAAASAMTLFFPELAPSPVTPSTAAAQDPQTAAGSSGSPGQVLSPVKQEQGAPNGSADVTMVPAEPAAADEAATRAEWLYKRYHAGVLELPAAETLHMQSQLKARLESGETAAPPDGMYLLPVELTEKPVGANAAGTAGIGAAAGGTPTPGSALGPAESVGGSKDTPKPGDVKPPVAAGGAAGARSSSTAAPNMGIDEAVFRSIMATSAGRPELTARLAAGLLLVGPGGGLRGLGSMLERRVSQRFSKRSQPQVVSTLEPRAEPAHVTWKGAALLAALDSGRENWLPAHQWVDGGMVLPAPVAAKQPAAGAAAASGSGGKKAAAAAAAAAASGAGAGTGAAAGSGTNSIAAAGRHTKLFYYCRAEQGMP